MSNLNDPGIRSFLALIDQISESKHFEELEKRKSINDKDHFKKNTFTIGDKYPDKRNLFLEFKGSDSNTDNKWSEELAVISFNNYCHINIFGFINTYIILEKKLVNPEILFGIHDDSTIHGIYKKLKPHQNVTEEIEILKKNYTNILRENFKNSLNNQLIIQNNILKHINLDIILINSKIPTETNSFYYIIRVQVKLSEKKCFPLFIKQKINFHDNQKDLKKIYYYYVRLSKPDLIKVPSKIFENSEFNEIFYDNNKINDIHNNINNNFNNNNKNIIKENTKNKINYMNLLLLYIIIFINIIYYYMQ